MACVGEANAAATSAGYASDCAVEVIGGCGASGRWPGNPSSTGIGAPRVRIGVELRWSSVHASHHQVDTGDRGDHVGDHAALAHRGHRLQIRERRITEMHASKGRVPPSDTIWTPSSPRGDSMAV